MNRDINDAAAKGDIQAIRRFIAEGVDVNQTDNDKRTPLHFAAEEGQNEALETLIHAGADVHVADDDKKTPLHLAAGWGHDEAVKTLITAGADVHMTDNGKGTPLHFAAEGGHKEAMKTLIQAGANVHVKDSYEKTPLQEAVVEGHNDAVKTLIQAGADVHVRDSIGWTPLYSAAEAGHNEVVKTLLQAGADVSASSKLEQTPLYKAASEGHDEVVKTLLQAGAEINKTDFSGSTPFHKAIVGGHYEVVRTLLQAGADAKFNDNNGSTLLRKAVERGDCDIVKAFLEAGVYDSVKENDGSTLLHTAVKKGRNNVVWTILHGGVDLNVKDNKGKTAKDLATQETKQVFLDFENAIKNTPKEIKVLGRRAILRYVTALSEDSSVSNVIRVMLVGHFSVGKTTIAMHLLEKKVKHIESTDGIEVYINQCLYSTESSTWHTTGKYNQTLLGTKDFIRLDLVDFAGQLIFYTTHQTYLTSRGLYLLVFDLTKGLRGEVEDEDLHPSKTQRRHVIDFLEYWISTITTYARGEQVNFPKIVLIGTHKDKVKDFRVLTYIKEEILRKFYKMVSSKQLIVRDELFISAKHMGDEAKKIIRDILLEEGMKYQEFGERIPSKWNALQEELLKLKAKRRYVVEMGDVRKINFKLRNPLDDEELGIFLKYLHNIGYILYFNTSVLNEKIILDPKFVIDAMRCFITCERFIHRFLLGKVWKQMRKSGEVKKSYILKAWKGRELAQHSEHLLAIMRKLDLICEPIIYRFGEKITSEFFVVPCMINAVKPEISIVLALRESQLVHAVEFSSETILPPAIFNRLVCSCLALWEIFEGHFYNGLVVLRSGRYHLIELSRHVKQITITFAHTEPEKRPDNQLCLAITQFLKETIDRIVAIYSTSFDEPISCHSSSLNFVDEPHTESKGNGDQQITHCRCKEFMNRTLEDINLMRIGTHLQDIDLSLICTALLNNAQFYSRIEKDHSRFKGDVKVFYILQQWKQETRHFTASELKTLLEDNLENLDEHIICQAMKDEELNAVSFDSTILVSKAYPEFLSATADKVTYKYMHLGLELGFTLDEIERLQMDKDNITLEITRAMLEKWYDTQKEEATVFNLVRAFHRCGVRQLGWMEEEFDVRKLKV